MTLQGPHIPPLFSPFRPAIHPLHREINEATAAWAEDFRVGSVELRRALARHDIGGFAARILPEAEPELIAVLAATVWWLFGVDDGECEHGPLGEHPGALAERLSDLLYVAEHPRARLLAGDPLAEGLRDLEARLSRYATDGQMAAWAQTLREYAMSVVREAEYRQRDAVPDLNAYLTMRLHDGATSVVPPFLEVGRPLTAEERGHRHVRAAADMASMIICWDNDLLSYHKETLEGRYCLNVIRVLQAHEGRRPEDAVAVAVDQRDRALLRFVAVSDQLRATASPAVAHYLDGLARFIRAAQDWGASSPRYLQPDGHQIIWHSAHPGTDSAPLDIPAAAHWWDLVPAAATAPAPAGSLAAVPAAVPAAATA